MVRNADEDEDGTGAGDIAAVVVLVSYNCIVVAVVAWVAYS